MSRTRTLILGGIVIVLGFVLYHAASPWGWTGQLKVPTGVAARSVSYTCGPPWGSGYVHGPSTSAYPIVGTPCGQRRDYQVTIGVDVVVAVFALTAVGLWARVRARPAAT